MQRTTIDFGIDLGTTNSVIAVSGETGVEVLKSGDTPITRSMVSIDDQGRILRGRRAWNSLSRRSSRVNVALEFKRRMGTKSTIPFPIANREMSPEELSAEVLIELRRTAQERFGSEPDAAVITVPAMFELPQNDATARAARLSGFTHSVLLQEPVAAAIARGFQSDADKVYWLVYDFGGGTFDASIVSIRDGQLSVVRHGGDNYLGGSDFDRLIVQKRLLPELLDTYDLDSLRNPEPGDHAAQMQMLKLRVAAETLKVELSRDAEYDLLMEDALVDDAGEPVDIDLTMTRHEFEQLIHPLVQRSIDLTTSLICDSGLSPRDIEKVVLVGGSTYVPHVREAVESLGIAVDREMDPMTIVAVGAATYAASKRMPKGLVSVSEPPAGEAAVTLEYEPVVRDLRPPVGGRVTIVDGPAPSDCTVELKTANGSFSSGDIAIDAKGIFFTEVRVQERERTHFRIIVRGPDGRELPCNPETFTIAYGVTMGRPILPRAVSIALADGRAEALVPEGAKLPATSDVIRRKFVRDLKCGSDDAIEIPFLSGGEDLAELNGRTITWKLTGTEIDRDLPAGTDVEITVAVDESGITTATLTIPLFDYQTEVNCGSYSEFETSDVMRGRLRSLEARADGVSEKAGEGSDHRTLVEISKLRDGGPIEQAEEAIQRLEEGDAAAAGQADAMIVEATRKIVELEAMIEWPARSKEYEEKKSITRQLVHEHGEPADQELLEQLVREGDRAHDGKDPKMLQRACDGLSVLKIAILKRDPAFWASFLAFLAEQESQFSNRNRGRELLSEGAMAMRRGDIAALETIVQQLMQLLPDDARAAVATGMRSDIL